MGNECCVPNRTHLNDQQLDLANEIVSEEKPYNSHNQCTSNNHNLTNNQHDLTDNQHYLTDNKDIISEKEISIVIKPSEIDVYTLEIEDNIVTYNENPFVE